MSGSEKEHQGARRLGVLGRYMDGRESEVGLSEQQHHTAETSTRDSRVSAGPVVTSRRENWCPLADFPGLNPPWKPDSFRLAEIRESSSLVNTMPSKNAACSLSITPSSELKRGRAGTESDLVHLLLGGTVAHRSFSNRAVPPMADHSISRLLSRLPRSPLE
jgi:hypothetical protein